jgi:hypothetical protein
MNFKALWGSGQSRTFKVGAWVVAIGLAAAWNTLDSNSLIKPAKPADTKKQDKQ